MQLKHRVVRIEVLGPVAGNSKDGFHIPIRYVLADGRGFNGFARHRKKRDAVARLKSYPRENVRDTALIFEDDGSWSGIVLWAPCGLNDSGLDEVRAK